MPARGVTLLLTVCAVPRHWSARTEAGALTCAAQRVDARVLGPQGLRAAVPARQRRLKPAGARTSVWALWWRRGESNPRPQVLDFRLYVRSPLFGSRAALPEGQGKAKRQRTVTLSDPARRTSDREPVSASPESTAQARTGRRSAAIRRRERSCRRWQLWFCSVIYEGTAPRYASEGSQPASKPVAPREIAVSIPHSPPARTGSCGFRFLGISGIWPAEFI